MPKIEYVKSQTNGYNHSATEAKRYQEEAVRKFREITDLKSTLKERGGGDAGD